MARWVLAALCALLTAAFVTGIAITPWLMHADAWPFPASCEPALCRDLNVPQAFFIGLMAGRWWALAAAVVVAFSASGRVRWRGVEGSTVPTAATLGYALALVGHSVPLLAIVETTSTGESARMLSGAGGFALLALGTLLLLAAAVTLLTRVRWAQASSRPS